MTTPIFLASGNRMKRVLWTGPKGTWEDPAALHKKGARRVPSDSPACSPRRGNSTLLAAARASTDAAAHRIPPWSLPPCRAAFYTDEKREFPEEDVVLTRRSFMLRDPDYGVAYEGLHLVREGASSRSATWPRGGRRGGRDGGARHPG